MMSGLTRRGVFCAVAMTVLSIAPLRAAQQYQDVQGYNRSRNNQAGRERLDQNKLNIFLFMDNSTWTLNYWLCPGKSHLFTIDKIVGIQIQAPTGKTVTAKINTSDDAGHQVTTAAFTETSAGVYRNTGTTVWPKLYREYQAANKRLKVVDEAGTLDVIPLIDGVEHASANVSGKVDLAEVAAVDGTDSLDASALYTTLGNGTHNWCNIGIRDINHSPSEGTGALCASYGASVDFLNVSGHGLTTVAQVYGSSETGVTYGLNSTCDPFTPEDIGTSWNGGELEWCLFAACSQVRLANCTGPTNNDNAVKWIKKMPKVHALLGYSYSAPGAGTDVLVVQDFCANLLSYTVVDAWMKANKDRLATNATALMREECVNDKMYTAAAFPTQDPTTPVVGNKYTYYYISGTTILTSSITMPAD